MLYPRQDSHKEEHIWEILPPLKEGRGRLECFLGQEKTRGRAEIVYPQRGGGGQAKEIKDWKSWWKGSIRETILVAWVLLVVTFVAFFGNANYNFQSPPLGGGVS